MLNICKKFPSKRLQSCAHSCNIFANFLLLFEHQFSFAIAHFALLFISNSRIPIYSIWTNTIIQQMASKAKSSFCNWCNFDWNFFKASHLIIVCQTNFGCLYGLRGTIDSSIFPLFETASRLTPKGYCLHYFQIGHLTIWYTLDAISWDFCICCIANWWCIVYAYWATFSDSSCHTQFLYFSKEKREKRIEI